MSKIAIDIVLLPDERAQTICRAVNQYIGGKIDFNATGKVPHISLMMGVVEEGKILQIFEILTEISKYFFLVNLRGLLKKYTIGNTGETGYSYELEENISIKKIFSEICEKIRPQLEYKDIALDMFYMPEEVEQQSVLWVKGFEERVVEEFSSHITLGIGELTGEHAKVIHFSTPKLAVYQLGNYCTCENKLFEINL